MKTYFAFTQMFEPYSVCTIIVQAQELEEAVNKINKNQSNVWDDNLLVKDYNYFPKEDISDKKYLRDSQVGISGEEFIQTKTEGWYDWMQFQATLPDGYEFYYSHSG